MEAAAAESIGCEGVIAPKLKPREDYYYNIDSTCVKDWLAGAVTLQARRKAEHDQSGTSYYRYTVKERGFLLQRICFSVYGSLPEGMSQYTLEQTREANALKRTIVEAAAEKDESASLNVVFLSTFQNLAGPFAELKLVATEVPVFVVLTASGKRVFVSTRGRSFPSVKTLLAEVGEKFKGGILYPAELSYGAREGELVQLHYVESAASSVVNRGLEVLADLVNIASVVFGVCSLAVCLPLPTYLLWLKKLATGVRATALVCLSTATLLGVTQASQTQSETTESGKMDKSTEGAIQLVARALFALFNPGKEKFAKIAALIGQTEDLETFQSLFTDGPSMQLLRGLKAATACATFALIVKSIYSLSKKKEWTRADLEEVAVSLFSLYNIVISPHSIEGFLKSSQMGLISQAAKGLTTEAAREAAISSGDFSELVTGDMTVRNVLQLREPDHFTQSAADIAVRAVDQDQDNRDVNDSADWLGIDDEEDENENTLNDSASGILSVKRSANGNMTVT